VRQAINSINLILQLKKGNDIVVTSSDCPAPRPRVPASPRAEPATTVISLARQPPPPRTMPTTPPGTRSSGDPAHCPRSFPFSLLAPITAARIADPGRIDPPTHPCFGSTQRRGRSPPPPTPGSDPMAFMRSHVSVPLRSSLSSRRSARARGVSTRRALWCRSVWWVGLGWFARDLVAGVLWMDGGLDLARML
jgi:hypothetical protein